MEAVQGPYPAHKRAHSLGADQFQRNAKFSIPRSDSTSDLFDIQHSFVRLPTHSNGRHTVQNRNTLYRSNTVGGGGPYPAFNTPRNPYVHPQRQQQQQQQVVRSGSRVKRRSMLNTIPEQRKRPTVGTISHFEACSKGGRVHARSPSHGVAVRQASQPLSPLQRQKLQMQQQFNFPNGEKFTPRALLRRQQEPATVQPVQPPPQVESPRVIKRSNSTKKLGSFLKLFSLSKKSTAKKQKPTVVPPVTQPDEPLTSQFAALSTDPQARGDDAVEFNSAELLDRLHRQWDVVHEGGTSVPSTASSQNSIMSSRPQTESTGGSSQGGKRSVMFASDIYVRDTFSPEEYNRMDEEANEAERQNSSLYGDKVVYDEKYGFVNEVKFELNQFKKNEMLVHYDSIQFTQFFNH
ncbi:uncharacterized protein KNAG_0G01740 [Huiozyma naganishii CBS 8797]|uniref:Uncharacterized protein n=1 Tax=Huiozyma naganishii (strain ATCC MYA-139 / BCRC 22969 / CBS 8797 / KCTC 17520 / NBRC 10181 / NCYC 3082 / Yp74L-3) TaxID=1071383 RepID=J7S0Z7_HUIN7|nr:hypothetical protein KNAG_0G01740 [Kazachstania naganishii CBS 8797]CCK71232.1 hypothetical protein KNAG_0G01740 [Kazachstania naganishii CBS 8797]